MKSTNTKGFTLVELIIVITILAILATIAFISFQGYAAEARNSKRTSDLNSMVKSIEVKVAEWISLTNVVTKVAAREIVGTEKLAWETIATTDYVWGTVNHTVVGGDANSFQDPLDKVGYSVATTTRAGWVYQLGAVKEVNGAEENYVLGTYTPRTAAAKTVTGMPTAVVVATDATFTATVWDTDLWHFKKDDVVTIWTVSCTIDQVSRDLKTLNITASADIAAVGTTIILATTPETPSLVKNPAY